MFCIEQIYFQFKIIEYIIEKFIIMINTVSINCDINYVEELYGYYVDETNVVNCLIFDGNKCI